MKSCDKGYDYFGLQFYGECWSGPDAADKFDHYGRSKKCVGYGYKKCDDKDSSECVGGRHKSYVYRVVKEGENNCIFRHLSVRELQGVIMEITDRAAASEDFFLTPV